MHELRFEWDEAKNHGNMRKHGVSFEEAQTVFLDDHAIRFYDPDHSGDEDRFLMMGLSVKLRLLIVLSLLSGKRWRHPNYFGPKSYSKRSDTLREVTHES